MRYVDSSGRVRQQQSFVCGKCGRDATPPLEFRDGRDAPPVNLRVECPHCAELVAVVNPTTAGVLSVPPGAVASPHDVAIVERQHAELERAEADTAADMDLEAEVRESQPPR